MLRIVISVNKKGRRFTDKNETVFLTQKQLDVLTHVVNGFSNEDIGKTLSVTCFTVKQHVYNLFKEFKVKNRTQLLLKVLELGIGKTFTWEE